MTTPALVLTLDEAAGLPAPRRRALLGGKAARLAEARRADLAVPDGFVVTAHAYRAMVRRALRGRSTAASVQEAIAESPLPEDLEPLIVERLAALVGDSPARLIAVRSSATDEDDEAQSFAGQQATVLSCSGPQEVLAGLRRVWSSLFDEQALLYRSQMSLESVPPDMAVLIQLQVPARAAGVCFTANPVTGAMGEMVISAARGLGETVVGGGASDTFYVSRGDGAIVRRELGGEAGEPALSSADIARIAALASQVEDHFGKRQDLEWAFEEGGGLWLLQARPITAAGQGADMEVWTNVNVGEALPGVGTPMTWSIIRGFARRGFVQAFDALGLDVPEDYGLVGSFRGRVYLNLSQFASIITQIPVMAPETLLSIAGGPRVDEIEDTIEQQSSLGFLKRLPLTIPKMIGSHLTMGFRGRRWARTLRKIRGEFHRRDLTRLSTSDLADTLDHVDEVFDRTGLVMLSVSSNFLSTYVATRELLGRWGGQEAASRENQLFSGLTDLRSAAPGLDMLKMAHHIRRHPRLEARFTEMSAEALGDDLRGVGALPGGRELQRMLRRFLDEHGHRAPREAEIATPRWREDPTFVLETVKTYLRAPYLPDPAKLEREQEEARQETTEAIRRFTTGFGLAFRQVLKVTQSNARLREDLRACVVDTLGMYRHVFVEAGRRMTRAGLLGDPEDVFFLTHDEVRAWLEGERADDFPVRAAMRRGLYTAFGKLPDPPDTFTLVGQTIKSTAAEPEGEKDELRGLPGSPGRATGRARVILDASDPAAALQPGEILVAPLTDVGWTPLFLVASGVVMAKGGPLSHACIVAREFGVPAAVNVAGAIERIKDGDVITVDGETGVVYLPREG